MKQNTKNNIRDECLINKNYLLLHINTYKSNYENEYR